MKLQKYMVLAAVALLTMVSCQKEQETTTLQFSATIARGMDSKVYLDGETLKPCWVIGDAIKVNGSTNGAVDSVSVSNATRATFTADNVPTSGPYYAIYPESIAPATVGATPTVTLPRVQEYRVVNGIQELNAPMAAYNPNDPNLMFYNLCGLLEIVVVNDKDWDMILDSIQVESSAYGLSGSMQVTDIETTDPHISAGTATGSKVVSLAKANDVSIGTRLTSKGNTAASDSTTTLYVYIPKIASGNTNAFTIRVFSHPVWVNTAGSTEESRVHIVYTRTQTPNDVGLGNGQIRTAVMRLRQAEPTFTSMMPFNVGDRQVCFSRGNVQFKEATDGYGYSVSRHGSGYNAGTWRFAPRQWSFLQKETMHYNEHPDPYTDWFEHFTWDSGNDPKHRYEGVSGSIYPTDFNNGGNNLSGVKDWGNNFTKVYSSSPWFTLSEDEFESLFASNSKYAWVELTNVKKADGNSLGSYLYGCVLLPNDVSFVQGGIDLATDQAAVRLGITGFQSAHDNNVRSANTMTVEQFEYFEARGCIFLPCIGTFLAYKFLGLASDAHQLWNNSSHAEGAYWTSTFHSGSDAYFVSIKANASGSSNVSVGTGNSGDSECYRKFCVRLVCLATTPYKYDPDQM